MEIAELFNNIDLLPQPKQAEIMDYIKEILSQENNHADINKPVFGSAKGRIYMSPDFDEPLEEFAEYMYIRGSEN